VDEARHPPRTANSLPQHELPALLAFALHTSRQAGEKALRYFQKQLEVERKPDSSPVTIADREVELSMRRAIEAKFPEHEIVGEEFGGTRTGAAYRWLLDPIDGTQAFIRGVPLWGVLIGLEYQGQPVVGVAHFPALRETAWAARGCGVMWNGQPARVSQPSELGAATLLYTDPRALEELADARGLKRLKSRCAFVRTWGDCYGHILVATGRAEIMLDPIMHEWDCCALMPIVEEAGGKFTDWRGVRTTRGASALSTNGLLHEEVLSFLTGGLRRPGKRQTAPR
jgi:histidinol phosphatase-like enzyme (inositol monophosphatase family)